MPAGRPRLPPGEQITTLGVGLRPIDRERLERLTERDGLTASEVFRRALVLYEQATSE